MGEHPVHKIKRFLVSGERKGYPCLESGQKVGSVIEMLAATGTASEFGGKSASVTPRPGASSITGSAFILIM